MSKLQLFVTLAGAQFDDYYHPSVFRTKQAARDKLLSNVILRRRSMWREKSDPATNHTHLYVGKEYIGTIVPAELTQTEN